MDRRMEQATKCGNTNTNTPPFIFCTNPNLEETSDFSRWCKNPVSGWLTFELPIVT